MNLLLEIKDLKVDFVQETDIVEAVRGIDLKIYEGEMLGLVGESGSGKSVTALSITKLLPLSAQITSGEIFFDGRDMLKLSQEDLIKVRGTQISYVFQDPATSLNPVFTIGEQLLEVIMLHHRVKKSEAFEEAVSALKDVGMPSPKEIMFSYPHQLSGGMKQRAMIAMAVSCRPKLLIADEPTTALDVTIQAQILELLLDLKERLGLTVLLITHDLSIVSQVANKTAVMQAGKIVEYNDTEIIYRKPLHQYTKELMGYVPKLSKDEQ